MFNGKLEVGQHIVVDLGVLGYDAQRWAIVTHVYEPDNLGNYSYTVVLMFQNSVSDGNNNNIKQFTLNTCTNAIKYVQSQEELQHFDKKFKKLIDEDIWGAVDIY